MLFSFGPMFAQNGEVEELSYTTVKELKGDSKATVIIESNVSSAEVYLNSVYQGTTKLKIQELLPAQYILLVQKKGFETKKYYITAKRGYALTYKVFLDEQIISENIPEEN